MIRAFAYDPRDDDDERLKKAAIFIVAASCCVAGTAWTAMYWFVFGWGLTTALPLSFVVIVGSALYLSHRLGTRTLVVYAQIICIIYVTAFIQWSVGGLPQSGFVMVWAFCGPMVALIFFSVRASAIWFALYVVNIAITVVFQDFFVRHGQPVTPGVEQVFTFMNFAGASLVVFIFAGYFVKAAEKEKRRADALLLNILPARIAARLKAGEHQIADYYPGVSVLFADIVGSTPMFSRLEPDVAVARLNEVFSTFDELVSRYGCEKIRTIGDNYMVAAGAPVPRDDHAPVLCHLALAMMDAVEALPEQTEAPMAFRMGINSGPAVAGVIGKIKFQYDIWGDAINIASRMESTGEVGRVQISDATYQLVKEDFEWESRGEIAVKGRGSMPTWMLVRAREGSAPPAANLPSGAGASRPYGLV